MSRKDDIHAHVESLLRNIGKADLADLGLHKNSIRQKMEEKLGRPVELRGSQLRCEPDKKQPGRRSSKTLGGEDHIG